MKNSFGFTIIRPFFLVCFALCFSAAAQSQIAGPPAKKYAIKISQSVTFDVDSEKVFIKRICAANSVTYNAYTHYFEVLTFKELNRNVVEGKLFKHATPMEDYIFNGIQGDAGNSTVIEPHQ